MKSAIATKTGGVGIPSVDVLRGFVLLVAALEYVRLFITPEGTHDPIGFGIHWVSLMWAPAFVFLFGTSAWFKLKNGMDRKSLSQFLLVRGVFLIALEILVVGFLWDFNPNIFPIYIQIIGVLGLSMIVLAGLVWLPVPAILTIAFTVIAGHNLFDHASFGDSYAANILNGLLLDSSAVCKSICKDFKHEPVYAFLEFPLIPWFAVLALGYATAGIFTMPVEERRKLLAVAGVGCVAGFLVLRALNGYGDPFPWKEGKDTLQTAASFVMPSKYPPSLMFLLLTLGVFSLVAAAAGDAKGKLAAFFAVFGRVPLFAYLLALLAAHVLALVLGVAQGFPVDSFLRGFWGFPRDFGVASGWVFLGWLAVIAFLYPICEWYGESKAARKSFLQALL